MRMCAFSFCKVDTTNNTVTDWQICRDVCTKDLLENPTILGGPDLTVAIYEIVMVRKKPENAQGKSVPEQWVFGGVDLTAKAFFMQLVPMGDRATLIPIIQANIAPGSRIWSDEQTAFTGPNGLQALGYANQSPLTAVHTNNIKARWNACKAKIRTRFGVRQNLIPSYLDEHMWRCRRDHKNVFGDLVAAICK